MFLPPNITADGNKCTVTLNSSARFTDGKQVTADEGLVYSISSAKNASLSKYYTKLENVIGYSATGT